MGIKEGSNVADKKVVFKQDNKNPRGSTGTGTIGTLMVKGRAENLERRSFREHVLNSQVMYLKQDLQE